VAAVSDVQDEIRAYVATHPGVRIEIAWRPVPADGRGPEHGHAANDDAGH
jgi:hypothetical protein